MPSSRSYRRFSGSNDVSHLSCEQVRSTFREDLRAFLADSVAKDRLTFDWQAGDHDPKGIYRADCRVEYPQKPLFVFGLATDGGTRDATITLLQYESGDFPSVRW